MGMTWQSLGLLKQNLGDVGEGITSYLKGRQEDQQRQQQYGAMQSFLGSPGGQSYDPQMANMMFPASGYNASSTLGTMNAQKAAVNSQKQSTIQQQIETAPKVNFERGGRGEVKAIRTNPLTGEYSVDPNTVIEGADPKASYGTRTMMDPKTNQPVTQKVNGVDAVWMEDYDRNTGQPTGGRHLEKFAPNTGGGTTIPGAGMDPAAMEFYALRELNGGGGPGTAISQRDVATKQAYANTLARVAKEHGITGDAAAGIPALYKSHQATLTQLQKTAAMTKTYEQTALKNLDIAEEMAKKYGRTAWPAANRFQNWFSENVDNNPNYTALENSIYTAAREYAKVTGGGAMSAQALTDSASKEAQKLINAGQSPEQFLAATSIMRRDMHNVPASFDAEIEAERGLLGSLINSTQARGPVNPAGGAPLAAPATGAKVKVRNKATGKTGTMSETSFNAHSDQYERVQ